MDLNQLNGELSDSTAIQNTAISTTAIQSPAIPDAEISTTEFNSEYCHVQYLESAQAVLLVWKKFASFDNYREPTSFALTLMQNNLVTRFVVDARNGFEDDKADVEWGFAWLLPEMAKTGCKTVVFVMNELHNDIGAEMDMWTVEFGKYFEVNKYDNLEDALEI
jgi:hypothetical protein